MKSSGPHKLVAPDHRSLARLTYDLVVDAAVELVDNNHIARDAVAAAVGALAVGMAEEHVASAALDLALTVDKDLAVDRAQVLHDWM